MTDSPIRLFPDPSLRKKSASVIKFDSTLQGVIRRLETVMRAQPAGIGIAAPQIGILSQIAIVDVSARLPDAQRLILVNPEIVKASERRLSREGCMSLPEYTAQIIRFAQIQIRWQDPSGRQRGGTFSGLQAVCIQHEIDHLRGVLIIDRVVSLKRDLIPRSAQRFKTA